jgi:indolepyruvate decarboxylase
MGREEVRRYVESSDCVIMLGAFMTDINLGVFTARLDPARCIYATSEKLGIRYHIFEEVRFKDFMRGLARAKLRRRRLESLPRPKPALAFGAAPRAGRRGMSQQRLTIRRLFERLNSFLTADTVVISDVGDALFGAGDLFIHRGTEFLAPAYYTSMGFAIPAAVGAQCANPKLRPLVLVGDGAFQMTGMELATVARYKLNPIVIVLNNGGYGTERPMQDGPYNDVWPWRFHRFPEVLGAGRGFLVETERDLNAALVAAEQHTEGFCLIEAVLDPSDRSPALERLTERMRRHI